MILDWLTQSFVEHSQKLLRRFYVVFFLGVIIMIVCLPRMTSSTATGFAVLRFRHKALSSTSEFTILLVMHTALSSTSGLTILCFRHTALSSTSGFIVSGSVGIASSYTSSVMVFILVDEASSRTIGTEGTLNFESRHFVLVAGFSFCSEYSLGSCHIFHLSNQYSKK
jgi:hypothetical protein